MHVLRDLGLAIETLGEGRAAATLPVVPQACDDAGRIHTTVLTTAIDVLGGRLAIEAVAPDWTATADMSLERYAAGNAGPIVAEGSVLRRGRTTVVIEVAVRDDGARGAERDLGVATMTFSILPRRHDTPVLDAGAAMPSSSVFGSAGAGLPEPLLDHLGVRVVDAASGTLEIDVRDNVRNSFGALQGGLVAGLADHAGVLAARAVGLDVASAGFSLHYLSPGRLGPVRTQARVLHTSPGRAVCRVEVVDAGAGDRLMAVATTTPRR